jgi:anti-sigma-K factor RskA
MIDRDDLDGLAAEYVVGTLSHDERSAVKAALASDIGLVGAIAEWEHRLSPLNEDTPDVAPPDDLYSKIEQRLQAMSQPLPQRRKWPVWQWRAITLAVALAFILAAGIASFAVYKAQKPEEAQTAGEGLNSIAVLQREPSAPAFLVNLDEMAARLIVRPLGVAAPTDKSYELWLQADNASAPRSLGVVPDRDVMVIPLKDLPAATLLQSTLTVSLEPLGGSPSGERTGPVVFTGTFVKDFP